MREFKEGDEVYLDFEEMERVNPYRIRPWNEFCLNQRVAIFHKQNSPTSCGVLIGSNSVRNVPLLGIKLNKNKIVTDILKDL